MKKSHNGFISIKERKLIDKAWKNEIESRMDGYLKGIIKTISYSKIKKENKLKFN
ncbi:MAG: addiction module protein [Ignavibacteriales bacterium]|nr:addiction module protein [Ignavibacteriales bacterium]